MSEESVRVLGLGLLEVRRILFWLSLGVDRQLRVSVSGCEWV